MTDQNNQFDTFAVPAPRVALPPEQVEFAKRVDALPDSLFADDPEVQRLTGEAALKELRVKRLALGMPEGDRRRLLEGLRKEIAQTESELLHSALDDALEGDHGFHRTIVLARHIEHLRRVLTAAEMAMSILTKSPLERIAPFVDEAERVRNALRSYLVDRKRDHLRQHARLQETDAAPHGLKG